MMHPMCWAERIAALETRMHELLVSHRILRTELGVAAKRDDVGSFLSNEAALNLYHVVSATMNQLSDFLEKHGAFTEETKPNLIRVFTSLPSEEAGLKNLERLTDMLRESVEIVARVLEERRRSILMTSDHVPHMSGIRLKAAVPEEPRITWTRVTPIPPIDPDAEPTDERFVVHVQRLSRYAIPRDADGNPIVADDRKKAAG